MRKNVCWWGLQNGYTYFGCVLVVNPIFIAYIPFILIGPERAHSISRMYLLSKNIKEHFFKCETNMLEKST